MEINIEEDVDAKAYSECRCMSQTTTDFQFVGSRSNGLEVRGTFAHSNFGQHVLETLAERPDNFRYKCLHQSVNESRETVGQRRCCLVAADDLTGARGKLCC